MTAGRVYAIGWVIVAFLLGVLIGSNLWPEKDITVRSAEACISLGGVPTYNYYGEALTDCKWPKPGEGWK